MTTCHPAASEGIHLYVVLATNLLSRANRSYPDYRPRSDSLLELTETRSSSHDRGDAEE